MNRSILIVDPDATRASTFAAVLNGAGEPWVCEFVTTGRDGLARLASGRVDLVVADLHAPGIGGIALLSTMAASHPGVIRFARGAGATEPHARAAASVQQFLDESDDPQRAIAQIRRAFLLRDTLGAPVVADLVGRLTTIPTLPALYATVAAELERPYPSGRRIGAIVSDDPAMATKLLQMVNSPFFGLAMRVSDPVHAVQLLGLDTVRALVLSTHVFESFRRPTRGVVDVDRLWRHAAAVGAIAGGLADVEGAPAHVVQDARTAGLLHDIGKLLLVATLPVVYARLIGRAKAEQRPLFELELEELGVTHAEIGAYLLGVWGLPDPIVDAVAWHHRPPEAAAGPSPLSFVVGANILESPGRTIRAPGRAHPVAGRLTDALVPLGVAEHAQRWLDWTDQAASHAA
jgi:HD-like signal output (HDOD) protein/CheY-like chemotaxis protein